MTLRERILTRLALAEAATPGPWAFGHVEGVHFVESAEGLVVVDTPSVTGAHEDVRFIADRSPDRVIAECRADLALLDSGNVAINGVVRRNIEARYPEGES
jgi:hypothetical protein